MACGDDGKDLLVLWQDAVEGDGEMYERALTIGVHIGSIWVCGWETPKAWTPERTADRLKGDSSGRTTPDGVPTCPKKHRLSAGSRSYSAGE